MKKFSIVIADDVQSSDYLQFIKHVIGEDKELSVIPTSLLGKQKERIDLALFRGGEDVNPMLYNENTGKFTSINVERDEKEKSVFHYCWDKGIPMLGICRGSQFLTVMSGGKLIQHVTGHGSDHLISANNGFETMMTSSHHQMLFPYYMPEEKYEIIAHSTYFRSNTYLNGENEEIKLPSNFLEPEIVYYKNTNALAIQGHPEWMDLNSKTVKYVKDLINNKLFNNKLHSNEL